jgi:hypothetical protein
LGQAGKVGASSCSHAYFKIGGMKAIDADEQNMVDIYGL